MELGKPALSILPSERSYTVIFLLDEVQVLPRVFDLKSIHGALRTLVLRSTLVQQYRYVLQVHTSS